MGGAIRILGLDPGSQVTGFGVVEQVGGELRHVAHGTVRPPRNATIAQRLHSLYDAVYRVASQHRPAVASIEQVFVGASPRSALVLGLARGAVLAAVGAAGVCVEDYAPSQIKQAVSGSGRATKPQIQTMVRRLLSLDRVAAVDASDALAAAICHAHHSRLSRLDVRTVQRRRRPAATALRVRRVT